ncbi:MAG: hypothetical protein Q8O56_15090 [Solirubrobacteraceae bacterium]|nr:hypothetical protein [Solirubrobacteraceae bacterium]
MATLRHIEEGYVYRDGDRRRLYDTIDTSRVQAVLLRQCIEWSIGPLAIRGCVNSDPLGVRLCVDLFDVALAHCTLSPASPSCTVGGCLEGYRAELTVTLNQHPFSLTITGTLCAPVAGCKSFNVTVPVGT